MTIVEARFQVADQARGGFDPIDPTAATVLDVDQFTGLQGMLIRRPAARPEFAGNYPEQEQFHNRREFTNGARS